MRRCATCHCLNVVGWVVPALIDGGVYACFCAAKICDVTDRNVFIDVCVSVCEMNFDDLYFVTFAMHNDYFLVYYGNNKYILNIVL